MCKQHMAQQVGVVNRPSLNMHYLCTICDTCSRCRKIRSILRPVFRRFQGILLLHKSLRGLDRPNHRGEKGLAMPHLQITSALHLSIYFPNICVWHDGCKHHAALTVHGFAGTSISTWDNGIRRGLDFISEYIIPDFYKEGKLWKVWGFLENFDKLFGTGHGCSS